MRLGLVLAFVVALPGLAQAQATEGEQKQACTGDAFRLCAEFIPNRQKIAQCMNAKRDELSPQCRAVMDRSGRPRQRP